MVILRRLLLGLLIGLALIRTLAYLAYAAASITSPVETYFLEAKMVLLASRAEAGSTLYPSWRDYPHVSNFYGPVYFGAVGLVGRAVGADIPGLFRIGRVVSFGSGLLTSLLVGVIAARRYGRAAGLAGAALGLATAPMIGFSVMTRPDLTAEGLGVLGFFLALGRGAPARALGGLVLVVAALTKQTAAIFLVMAVLAWAAEGNWRRGLRLTLGVAATLGAVVGGVTMLVEPNFAGSLLGDSATPWDRGAWVLTFTRLVTSAPDVLYFPAVGVVLWASRATGRREPALAVLAGVLLATSLITSAKLGSDLNYYLSLRVVETLAVGALWQAWAIATSRLGSVALLAVALGGCLTVVPGTSATILVARAKAGWTQFYGTSQGRALLAYHRSLEAMAADPRSRLLTDSGMIDLYQGERAAFGDPYLFRVMVNTGRIDPTLIRTRIDSGYYDLIVTTRDIHGPSYDTEDFSLPATLADRVRARYVLVDSQFGLFLYGPRSRPISAAVRSL